MKTPYFNWQRRSRLALHVLGWLCFLSFPILFFGNGQIASEQMLTKWEFWFSTLCFLFSFYLNAYFWMPYIIKNRKFITYAISILVMGALFAFSLKPFDRLMRIDGERYQERRSPAPPPIPNREPHIRTFQRIDTASIYISCWLYYWALYSGLPNIGSIRDKRYKKPKTNG